MKLSWFESRFSRRSARLARKADDGSFTFDKDDDCLGHGDGDDDGHGHGGGDGDEGSVCIEFTSALFDKSNTARDVREERGPEVVFVNFWDFLIKLREVDSYPQCHHQDHLSAALKACSS